MAAPVTWPSLAQYLDDSGLPHRITSTTGGVHTPGSYHYLGEAIDAAGPTPSYDDASLHVIQNAFVFVADQLAELIGPMEDLCIKNGNYFLYDATTLAAHKNHVHVASTVDVVWPRPPEAHMPIWTACSHPSWGGYIEASDDGRVNAYDAPFHGSALDPPPLGVGRPLTAEERVTAIMPSPTGNGYWLCQVNGGILSFGDAVYHGGANAP